MRKLVIAHSPDSDDAYMMAPLALEWLQDDDDFQHFSFEFVRSDIETLNQLATVPTYDVTAISFAAYPEIEDKYDLLRAGSSIQDGSGPIVISQRKIRAEELFDMTVAIPGKRTSAFLTMCRWMPGLNTVVVPFDKIMNGVATGLFDAGLLIHESQLMYESIGLHKVVDLGEWWKTIHDLPLPMGGNAIRKDIPQKEKIMFARLMRKSVNTAINRHQESIDYAQSFGRGMDREMVERYVRGWVNDFTIDIGDRGMQAVSVLLGKEGRWVEP
ncbi:MAG: hypothetical protein FWG02_09535 [Holophagaceae bacterium]|nr:hypothetical protein [Holophagaceae bacterium]